MASLVKNDSDLCYKNQNSGCKQKKNNPLKLIAKQNCEIVRQNVKSAGLKKNKILTNVSS